MMYYSTNGATTLVDFKEATIRGQAPDGGLYFPSQVPVLSPDFWNNFPTMSYQEIAFQVMRPFTGSVIPEEELLRIVTETVSFPFPLVSINGNAYALELFHGPTLAFKDVGARFMSRCLGYFSKERSDRITVLVATSGDTGGAVASGFFDVEGVDVVILYPSGKVSSVQEKQLTTMGRNIHALEVEGNFDDCQRMVKAAFSDKTLTDKRFLTSANSINVARWLPQQVYYFFALQQWPFKDQPPVISVPSGNFGNICAGLMAYAAGLPVSHFIAACNANDTVPQFFQTGKFAPRKAVPTISNAMDVGDPSNFVRILELFSHDSTQLQKLVSSVSISDELTRQTIAHVLQRYSYLLDPHGAVAYAALEQHFREYEGARGLILETAHPVKFPDVVEEIKGSAIDLPHSVRSIMTLQKKSTVIAKEYAALKEFLLGM